MGKTFIRHGGGSSNEDLQWCCFLLCSRCLSGRPAQMSPSPPESVTPAPRAGGRWDKGWRSVVLRSLKTQMQGLELTSFQLLNRNAGKDPDTPQKVFETHVLVTGVTHMGRQWCRLWRGSEFLPSWPWSAWVLAPRLSSVLLPFLSPLGSPTQVLWMSVRKTTTTHSSLSGFYL